MPISRLHSRQFSVTNHPHQIEPIDGIDVVPVSDGDVENVSRNYLVSASTLRVHHDKVTTSRVGSCRFQVRAVPDE